MTETIYIPILHGRYHEDGEDILDARRSEDSAIELAEEKLTESHYSEYFVAERELTD